eukprot:scaffold15258_cov111-Isochrysis_galbana.AAC.6
MPLSSKKGWLHSSSMESKPSRRSGSGWSSSRMSDTAWGERCPSSPGQRIDSLFVCSRMFSKTSATVPAVKGVYPSGVPTTARISDCWAGTAGGGRIGLAEVPSRGEAVRDTIAGAGRREFNGVVPLEAVWPFGEAGTESSGTDPDISSSDEATASSGTDADGSSSDPTGEEERKPRDRARPASAGRPSDAVGRERSGEPGGTWRACPPPASGTRSAEKLLSTPEPGTDAGADGGAEPGMDGGTDEAADGAEGVPDPLAW